MSEKIVTFKLDLNRSDFFIKNSDGFQAHTNVEFTPLLLKDKKIINISTCTDGKFLYVTYHYLTNEE